MAAAAHPKTVIPAFFLIGLVFIPIGVTLFLASQRVVQLTLDYSLCSTAPPDFAPASGGISRWRYDPATRVCQLQFAVPSDMAPPVFLYYRLTNFYQNNRRYVKSFDLKQLGGQADQGPTDLENCEPLRFADPATQVVVGGANVTVLPGAVYYPCGLIANSLFSDEISDLSCVAASGLSQCQATATAPALSYPFASDKIAWPADADRFGMTQWTQKPDWQRKIVPPPFWRIAFPQFRDGYTLENLPNLKEFHRLHVWMRTAGLPTFRKLWGSSETQLFQGTWQINITQSIYN